MFTRFSLVAVVAALLLVGCVGPAGISIRPVTRVEYGRNTADFKLPSTRTTNTTITNTETIVPGGGEAVGNPHVGSESISEDSINRAHGGQYTSEYGQVLGGVRFEKDKLALDFLIGPQYYWADHHDPIPGVNLNPRLFYRFNKDTFLHLEADLTFYESGDDNIYAIFAFEKVW